jgi:hypothetical protein
MLVVVNTALATAKDPKKRNRCIRNGRQQYSNHYSINSKPSIALVKTAAGGTGKGDVLPILCCKTGILINSNLTNG